MSSASIADNPPSDGMASFEKDVEVLKSRTRDISKKDEQAAALKDKALEGEKGEIARQKEALTSFDKDHPFPHPDMKPWTEKSPEPDPMSAFGSWASAFGILAGAVTKTGLASSLNASAAAISAYRKNDMDGFNERKKIWKENLDESMKAAEWEAKAYQAAFERMRDNNALGMAEFQAAAAQADNQFALDAAKKGDIKTMWDITKGMAEFHAQGPERELKLREGMLKFQQLKQTEDLVANFAKENAALQKSDPVAFQRAILGIRDPAAAVNVGRAEDLAEQSKVTTAAKKLDVELKEAGLTNYHKWSDDPANASATPEQRSRKMFELTNPNVNLKAPEEDAKARISNLKADEVKEREGLFKQAEQAAMASNPNMTPEERAELRTKIMDPKYFIAKGKAGGAALTPEAVKLGAKLFEETGVMPALGYSASNRVAILNQAAEDGVGSSDIRLNKSMGTALSSTLGKVEQQKAAIQSFEQTARQNGRVALSLVDKVDSSGVPVFQRWINAGRRATGDPDVARFDAQMKVYIPELGKILNNPGMTGVTTVHAMKEAEEIRDGMVTSENMHAVIPLLEQDFKNRLDSIKDEESQLVRNIKNIGTKGGGAADPGYYETTDDVGAAFRSGAITREEAAKILKQKFKIDKD